MSSIIDALKKSDAKRPKKNHGVNIHMDLNNNSHSKRRWVFYAIVAILSLILTAVYFQKPDFVWQHVGSAKQTAVTENKPEKTVSAPKQTKKLNKPAPEHVQSAVKNRHNNPTDDPQAVPPRVPEAQKTQPVVVYIKDENSTENGPTTDHIESESNQTEQRIQQQIDQQLADTPMKNKQAIQAPSDDSQNQPQPKENLPQFFELPYSIRKDLPKLNLSVHVYDPVAENRMAILNGVPIHVGDTFEETIIIQDITQSGVVLRLRDRDFIVLK